MVGLGFRVLMNARWAWELRKWVAAHTEILWFCVSATLNLKSRTLDRFQGDPHMSPGLNKFVVYLLNRSPQNPI